jgi:uncharacterized membrane protein
VKRLGLGFVFFWFLIGGIAHFTLTDFEMRMVPPYIPWPYAVVIASGVFELIGAAALLWKFTRPGGHRAFLADNSRNARQRLHAPASGAF